MLTIDLKVDIPTSCAVALGSYLQASADIAESARFLILSAVYLLFHRAFLSVALSSCWSPRSGLWEKSGWSIEGPARSTQFNGSASSSRGVVSGTSRLRLSGWQSYGPCSLRRIIRALPRSVPQYAAGIPMYHWPRSIGFWTNFAKWARRAR